MVFRVAHCGPDARDGLNCHACSSDVVGVLKGAFTHGMDCDSRKHGDISERSWRGEQPQGVTTPGAAQRPVLVVRRGVVPGAQTGGLLGALVSERKVVVGQREQIGGKGVVVVVVQTLGPERTGGEFSGCGVCGGRRLDGVVRSPVVTGWSELVTAGESGRVSVDPASKRP